MTFQNKEEALAWQQKYDLSAPEEGDIAPDFQLSDTRGENPLTLSRFRRQKPVALIFGSFTWPPFVRQSVSLHQLYQQYYQRIEFLVIYIREAHPIDGWDVNSPNRITDPKTTEERCQVAAECQQAMQYGIRTYLDEIYDPVMKAYAAWPERLYLIDLKGKVVYASGLGPWGFKPEELQQAIDGLLAGSTLVTGNHD